MDPLTEAVFRDNAHGGASQVLHAAATLLGGQHTSVLASRLLLLWSWGLLTTPHLQFLAEGAILDGTQHPDLDKLAALGAHGAYAGNTRRDLLKSKVLRRLPSFPDPAVIRIPLLVNGIVQYVDYPILLPAAVFDSLVIDHRPHFEMMIGKGPKFFWQNVRQQQKQLKSTCFKIMNPLFVFVV